MWVNKFVEEKFPAEGCRHDSCERLCANFCLPVRKNRQSLLGCEVEHGVNFPHFSVREIFIYQNQKLTMYGLANCKFTCV